MFPTLTGPHGRHGRSPLRTPRTLLAAAALGLLALAPVAAAPPPGTSDVVLARAALAALDADGPLRDVNLVVSVVDRVAVIGGPVPSAEHGKRAEALVRGVHGIEDVKNRCFVQPGADPLVRAVADRLGPAPWRAAPALPGVVPHPRTGVASAAVLVSPEATVAAADPAGDHAVVVRRPANPVGGGVLLPPIGASPSGSVLPVVPPVVTPPTAVLTAGPSAPPPATLPGRTADVLTAAAAVRNADSRFAGLTAELHDGTLVIAGSAARAADAWEFAQALRRLPGVARVAVGAVSVP
jgi:hypothetical protein